VCITYDPTEYSNPSLAQLFHYQNNAWVDVTTSNDTTHYIVCGQVTSLSPFAVATFVDKTPPVISGASANPSTLWPPNDKMVTVTVNYQATDNSGQATCKISSVTSNEPITGADYAIVDAHHVTLSANRFGNGNGRTYTITITCTDPSGNASTDAVTVTVPHDQGKK